MEETVVPRFDPYAENGGTVLAIAGDDFCIAAGDTRQSDGFSIHTRFAPKVYEIRNNILLCTAGFQADILTLRMLIEKKMELYYNTHEKHMIPKSFAQMLSNALYGRRFFPYYAWNVLATLDEKGHGVVYQYDPVGSYEAVGYTCAGTGSKLIIPFLDNQLSKIFQEDSDKEDVTLDGALKLVKDAFSAAAESDIYTGDMAEIYVITRDGVSKQQFLLRAD